MKAIYIRPLTELVKLNTQKGLLWGEDAQPSNPYDHVDANDHFFDDEDIDYDDYDPFFDE